MTLMTWTAIACGSVTLAAHLTSIAIATMRCRKADRHHAASLVPAANEPPITIIRPACGHDSFLQATLRSTFELQYPDYEILFCVASAHDSAVPTIEALIAAHPSVRARLLIGDERISANPKLNNMIKGWRAAAHDLVVVADSNLLMPPDYLHRLMASWQPDTGIVSAPPVGSHPQGLWAEVECAFLNTYQVRWQYVADTLGLGFAQGKTLFYRRSMIEAAGGLRALAAEAAEDAASTKLIRSIGLRVRLADQPFQQPLGLRTFSEVWDRQVRWARLRRDSFPQLYAMEIGAGPALPLAAAAILATAAGTSVTASIGAMLLLWYAAEAMLAALSGWRLTPAYPLYALMRDALLPILWLEGWRSRGFVWRGHSMTLEADGRAQ